MAKSKDGQNKKKMKISTVLIFFFCSIVAFTMLVPFVWMVSASFKLNSEIFSYPVKWIPEVFRTLNYEKVWQSIPFLQYFLNTLKLAVIITLLQLFTCSLAAFAFTKLHFPGRDKIFVAYLATMMVPWHAIMIPQFIVVKAFGMYNTHLSLIVLQAFSAFGVFLLRQNMLSIPDSLHEAAKIDGCSTFGIYRKIILPLSQNGLATLTVLTFNSVWNDYMGHDLSGQRQAENHPAGTGKLPAAVFRRLRCHHGGYGMLRHPDYHCLLHRPEVYRGGRCLCRSKRLISCNSSGRRTSWTVTVSQEIRNRLTQRSLRRTVFKG